MLLIAYDGSPDSQAAIDHVARLTPGARVAVLTAWTPYIEAMAGAGMGLDWMPYAADNQEIDKAAEDAARKQAEEGAARASAAGLEAEALTKPRIATIHETILSAADELDADAVVLGSRGLTGLKSMLLGSVSDAVAQHADRPVMIVPGPAVAEERQERRSRHREAEER
jgi:nucleotide-binding universal stress UspA family protein